MCNCYICIYAQPYANAIIKSTMHAKMLEFCYAIKNSPTVINVPIPWLRDVTNLIVVQMYTLLGCTLTLRCLVDHALVPFSASSTSNHSTLKCVMVITSIVSVAFLIALGFKACLNRMHCLWTMHSCRFLHRPLPTTLH